jgi:hypothetical protein
VTVGRRFAAALLAASVAAGCLAASSSAMLPWIFVSVRPNGPSPKVVRAVAGVTPVAWYGTTLQGHRVLFTAGACRTRVASPAGPRSGCIFPKAGRYPYRLEGSTLTGVVVVRAA